MDEHIVIRMASDMIKKGECDKLAELYGYVTQLKLDHAYILQKSYLNACVSGNPVLVRYFFELAHACSDVDKIRIRQAFVYSKYIIRGVSSDELSALMRRLYPQLPPPIGRK